MELHCQCIFKGFRSTCFKSLGCYAGSRLWVPYGRMQCMGESVKVRSGTWSGLPCKNRPESCKNIQKQESGRSASKTALTSGLSHVQPQRRSKMVSHKFEHASWFPWFPLQWLFSCHQRQSTHQNTVVIWGALDIISWQEIHLKDSKSGMECRENDMSTSESYPVLNPCWRSHGAESSSPAATLPPPAPVVCRDASSAANFPWTHMPRRHPRHQPSPLSGQPHRLGRWMAECVPNRLFGSWEVRKKSPQSFNLIIVSFAVSFQWLW